MESEVLDDTIDVLQRVLVDDSESVLISTDLQARHTHISFSNMNEFSWRRSVGTSEVTHGYFHFKPVSARQRVKGMSLPRSV